METDSMLVKRSIRAVLATIAVVLGFGSPVRVQVPAVSRLTFRVSTENRVLLPLEPVPITLSVINNTPNPIRGYLAVSFESSNLKLIVRQPSGKVVESDQLSVVRALDIKDPNSVVLPGAEQTSHEWLTFDQETLFPTVGVYQLTFQAFEWPSREWRASNPVTVRVGGPRADDRAAYEYLRQSPKAADGWFEVFDADELEQFLALFPNSRYADYARTALGNWKVIKNDYQRAVELLTPVVTAGRPSLAQRAAEHLEKAKQGLEGEGRR
jgi:hypothetical protein